eukprot:TRINITY_DN5742_c0_g1_i1.p1 TRINITY_DN5742_c0_g1~~TRINITY_DN5742_c0_g1_i1.p1  ORF type:complete len:194 (-),score=54.87 TRINITY_DN5742_c0_g1_i1:168-749(-)
MFIRAIVIVAAGASTVLADEAKASFFSCNSTTCLPLAGLFVLIVAILAITKLFLQSSPGTTPAASETKPVVAARASSTASVVASEAATPKRRARPAKNADDDEPASPRSVKSTKSTGSARSNKSYKSFKGIKGVGPVIAEKLIELGIDDVQKLAAVKPVELSNKLATLKMQRTPQPSQIASWVSAAKDELKSQ